MIAPWEIDELPEEWRMAFTALAQQYPDLKAGLQKAKDSMDKLIRTRFPRFRGGRTH